MVLWRKSTETKGPLVTLEQESLLPAGRIPVAHLAEAVGRVTPLSLWSYSFLPFPFCTLWKEVTVHSPLGSGEMHFPTLRSEGFKQDIHMVRFSS